MLFVASRGARACRTVLSSASRIEFAREPDGLVSCETASACTAVLSKNAVLRSSGAEIQLDQRPCFDASGNNAPACCGGAGCASWAGAAIKSLDCVDSGILHLSYALSPGVTVFAPLTSWQIPAGTGHVTIARSKTWVAVVSGGKVLSNQTRKTTGPEPLVLRLVTETGSAPYYEIIARPPGVGGSGNSGGARFISPAGTVRGPTRQHVNNASAIHLTGATPATGKCARRARGLPTTCRLSASPPPPSCPQRGSPSPTRSSTRSRTYVLSPSPCSPGPSATPAES